METVLETVVVVVVMKAVKSGEVVMVRVVLDSEVVDG